MIARDQLIPGSHWRHVKSGNEYVIIGIAIDATNRHIAEVVVYQANTLGTLFVRDILEFCDGRFDAVGAGVG